MSEKKADRLTEPKCRCGWTKRILPSGIMICSMCDHGHSIPKANGPEIRPAWPGETS